MVSNVVITLLRHGRTVDNDASRYSGWINSQLSEPGKTEIKEINKQYKKEGTFFKNIDYIYTSDLDRTIETAELLFHDNYPIRKLKRLREMDFGDFEGLTYDELKYKQSYQDWLNDLFIFQIPNGESFKEFIKRIDFCFNQIKAKIIEENLKHVVFVAHGGVIRHLLMKLTNDQRPFFDWNVTFTRGYQLTSSQAELKEENPCMSLQVVPIMENGNS